MQLEKTVSGKSLVALSLIVILGMLMWYGVGNAPKASDSSVVGTASEANAEASAQLPTPPLFSYIEVVNGCGHDYADACAVARTAPTTSAPVALTLRKGMVLEVASTTIKDGERAWYRVTFSEWVRYPERLTRELYVASDTVRYFTDIGAQDFVADEQSAPTPKHIVIDRSDQKLYAYNGVTLFMETPISTGLDLTPTPRGTFHVYRKTPSRYMQGPLLGISDQYYDLPGVPWDLYFTAEGGAIHGAYWHDSFGQQWSHGCVNLPLTAARMLYVWAPVGTLVTVQD